MPPGSRTRMQLRAERGTGSRALLGHEATPVTVRRRGSRPSLVLCRSNQGPISGLFVLAVVAAARSVVRTALEDAMLRRELAGYGNTRTWFTIGWCVLALQSSSWGATFVPVRRRSFLWKSSAPSTALRGAGLAIPPRHLLNAARP